MGAIFNASILQRLINAAQGIYAVAAVNTSAISFLTDISAGEFVGDSQRNRLPARLMKDS